MIRFVKQECSTLIYIIVGTKNKERRGEKKQINSSMKKFSGQLCAKQETQKVSNTRFLIIYGKKGKWFGLGNFYFIPKVT